MLEIRGGYWIYEISKTEDNPDTKGLTFLIYSKIKDRVTDFKTYSKIVTEMGVNLQEKDSVIGINAYAPTSSSEDKKVEHFHGDIERAMADSDSKYKIITGDFNAKEMELRQKRKTSKAWEHLKEGREVQDEIA